MFCLHICFCYILPYDSEAEQLDTENSWFWVHEVKRLVFSLYMAFVYTHPSMAAHLPCLPGSPSSPWGPHFLRSACP